MKRLVALAVVTGCATAAVSAHDADEVYDNLMVLSNLPPDQATLLRMSLDQCADLPSCAGGCKAGLSAAAGDGVDAAERGAILAQCFSDLKDEHARSGISGDAWFARYFARYLDRVEATLSPEKKASFTSARTQLHLVP
jgi:hypothetical protein